jgi:hypothetical protein
VSSDVVHGDLISQILLGGHDVGGGIIKMDLKETG